MTKETFRPTMVLSIMDIILFAYKYVNNFNKSSVLAMIFLIFNKKQHHEKTSQLIKSVILDSK